jgi:hypothetical protein
MATKKFSLKDNPIFERTTIPVKKDREKHPLNAVYSEKTKRKVSDKSSLFTDKVKEWSAKKINNKALYSGIIVFIVVSSLYVYLLWREVSKMDHPTLLMPLTTEVEPLITEVEYIQKSEEVLLKETSPVAEELPPSPPVLPKRLKDEKWLLSAIIFDKVNSRALINNRIVRKGDTFQEGVEVAEITQNTVVLTRGEETFTLRLD